MFLGRLLLGILLASVIALALLAMHAAILGTLRVRARSFALLFALGLAPRKLLGWVLLETSVVSGVAAAAGAGVAEVAFRTLLRQGLGISETLERLELFGALGLAIASAVLAASLSGLWPGYRAAHPRF